VARKANQDKVDGLSRAVPYGTSLLDDGDTSAQRSVGVRLCTRDVGANCYAFLLAIAITPWDSPSAIGVVRSVLMRKEKVP